MFHYRRFLLQAFRFLRYDRTQANNDNLKKMFIIDMSFVSFFLFFLCMYKKNANLNANMRTKYNTNMNKMRSQRMRGREKTMNLCLYFFLHKMEAQ